MALASGVQTINCTRREMKLYIYKKKNTTKQCENSDQLKMNKKKNTLESSLFFYHTESAISHQQREPVIKSIEAYCTDSSSMLWINPSRPPLQRLQVRFYVGNPKTKDTLSLTTAYSLHYNGTKSCKHVWMLCFLQTSAACSWSWEATADKSAFTYRVASLNC